MKKLRNSFLLGTAFSIAAAGIIFTQTNCGVYGPPPAAPTEEHASSAELPSEDTALENESDIPDNK